MFSPSVPVTAGYLGDIGVPPPYGPVDFAGWFEAHLRDAWRTFDARNNTPRIGRVRRNTLQSFRVWTDELAVA